MGGCATAAREAEGRDGNGSAVTSGNVAKADSDNGTWESSASLWLRDSQ